MYDTLVVKTMRNEYRIEYGDNRLPVTKEAAMYETAKILVTVAIEAHMLIHKVDRETATRWVFSVMDVTNT